MGSDPTAGHLGISKCKGGAQLSVWWPDITSQINMIKAMRKKCCECLLHRAERKEPLLAMVPSDRIWDRDVTDLFEYNKKHYVVVLDYASRRLDFNELSTTTSQGNRESERAV